MRKDLEKLIHSAASAVEVSEQEMYKSSEYKRYMQTLADTVLDSTNIEVNISYIPQQEDVACTNGKTIYLNAANNVAGIYTDVNNKFAANMGILFHECSHILFIDFNKENSYFNKIRNGEMPIKRGFAFEEKEVFDNIADTLRDNVPFRAVMESLFGQISNIVADANNEMRMMEKFGGVVEKSIQTSAMALKFRAKAFEDMVREAASQNAILSALSGSMDDESFDALINKMDFLSCENELSILMSMLLQYVRYDAVITQYTIEGRNHKLMKLFEKLKPIAKAARGANNTNEIWRHITRLIIGMWDIIKRILDGKENTSWQENGQGSENDSGADENSFGNNQSSSNEQNQSGQDKTHSQGKGNTENGSESNSDAEGNDSSSSQSSENAGNDAISKLQNAIKEAVYNTGSSTRVMGRKTSPSISETTGQTRAAHDMDEAKNQIQQCLDRIESELKEKKAQDVVNTQSTNELIEILSSTSLNTTHKGLKHEIYISPENKCMYDQMFDDVSKSVSKAAQKLMKNYLRNLAHDDISKHLAFGRRVECGDTYRKDGRCFSKRKDPSVPTLAISMLIDNSGSMAGGRRLHFAMKAGCILEDFARGMDFPCMITGHNSLPADPGTELYICSMFDSVKKEDKYRICGLTPHSSNRDGMAIQMAANALSKRNEDIKLLFIISDGQPNDTGYCGEAAYKDIADIVKKLQKKDNIATIAFAIGEDKDKLKRIYREQNFVNISELQMLPKQMLKVIRKYITI